MTRWPDLGPASPALVLIWNLFGGKDRYEQLPQLQMGASWPRGWTGEINASILTAPIMRGKEHVGREFFALKTVTNSVMVLFQYHEHSLEEWTYCGTPFVDMKDGFLIKNQYVSNVQAYQQLKQLIETGKTPYYNREGYEWELFKG